MNKIKWLFNKHSLTAARNLTLFALVCLTIVSVIYWIAAERIEQQITDATLLQFRSIAPELSIDDSLLHEVQTLNINGRQVEHYQAIEDGQVKADFFRATTGKGYSGDITLLIGISADRRTILGVRTLAHKETPGLGDKIDNRISPWIYQFNDLRIEETRFAVQKDGGDFDAFTGATITPRAVTELVGQIARAWQQRS